MPNAILARDPEDRSFIRRGAFFPLSGFSFPGKSPLDRQVLELGQGALPIE
jgi:hypothetical protein